jgi:hypothetical protein
MAESYLLLDVSTVQRAEPVAYWHEAEEKNACSASRVEAGTGSRK